MFHSSEVAAQIASMTLASHNERLTLAYREGRERKLSNWMDGLLAAAIVTNEEFAEIEASYWDGRQDQDEIEEMEDREREEGALVLVFDDE